MSVPQDPVNRNDSDDHEARRTASLAKIALELSHPEIAALVARAGAGDPGVVGALDWNGLAVDDLRDLLQTRVELLIAGEGAFR